MKNSLSSLLVALVTALVFQCCTGGAVHDAEIAEFNEHIAGYTYGSIPRRGSVSVIFSADVPESVLANVDAATLMRLKPAVEGKFAMADGHTLVFTPTAAMERNTEYTATVDVARLFPEGGTPFTFRFTTRPFALNGALKSFDVSDDDTYELTFNISSADVEDAATVEKHIALSANGESSWTHSNDGTSHQLTVRIKPIGQQSTTLEVKTVADASLGLAAQTLATAEIPSAEKLAVVSREWLSEAHCIEVTFNKRLDVKQDVRGLAYIMDHTTQVVADGNKIRLYASLNDGEEVQIMLDGALRSSNGKRLGDGQCLKYTVEGRKPRVEFLADGTIVPQADKVVIPFRSIYMRGVRVMVYKVYANQMGTFLQQNNNLRYCSGLVYAARPVAATTFYMDGNGAKLNEWHTYAIDLTEQVRLEPGAMYRVELSLDARLSAWPSDSLPTATRAEIAAEDARILEQAMRGSDDGQYYYTGRFYDDSRWWSYWRQRNDPSMPAYYNDRTEARNLLATNIGLSAVKGAADVLNVTAINLPDATPLANIAIEVYSFQQQLIGEGKTNAQGVANVPCDARLGQPSYVIARRAGDVSYLKVMADCALSTSTFDVSGDVVARGLKGYIYGERGVWRPGDTLYLGFMLNDRDKTLPQEHPVTLQLTNPLGQEVNRITRTRGSMGLYTFAIPLAADAPTGLWTAAISVGGVTFNKTLRIETIKPNRLKIDLNLPIGALANGSNLAQLHTEWLNGSRASGLRYEISSTIVEGKTSWPAYKGYTFDDPTKSFESADVEIAQGRVDNEGGAVPTLKFAVGKTAPGMLRCNLVTRVFEPSGEFSTDVAQAQLSPYSRYIGLKSPQQDRRSHLNTGTNQTFQLVSVDSEGKALANVPIRINVYKVNWHWWWSSTRSDMAGYTTAQYNQPVRTINVTTDASGQASFPLKMSEADWGTYLIVANDLTGGHSTGLLSYFDWPWMTSREASANATSLTLATDKTEYAPGEQLRVSFPSAEGSRAIVSICNGSKILQFNTYQCKPERTEIALPVTDEMTPNVYVAVSLVQPYNQTLNDMPIRMYGIVPVAVTSAKSHLHPAIACADEFQPESQCRVTVSEQDGRPMAYTLAVVDEGLLDLTRFKTPDAWPLFNAREALGVRFWDLYSDVRGAYGGTIEQMFSIGGDEALNNGPKAIVNRFTPMVHFSGPYTLKRGESNVHKVDVPNYNGRVRVMVVAGDGTAYGNAERSVTVRRPLMLIGTMPRQIGVDDEMTVSATLFATQPLDAVQVSLSVADGLQVIGQDKQQISFAEAGDRTLQFRIKAGSRGGCGTVSIRATSGSHKADYTARIDIRSVSQGISRTVTERVEAGASAEKLIEVPGDGDFRVAVSASANKPLNLNHRLGMLLGYPHGCVEQTISRVFPQLLIAQFTALSEAQLADVERNVKAGITRLATYQTADGGMAYWPGGASANTWTSAYALHFLTEASARGYYVPEEMLRRLRQYVARRAGAWTKSADAHDAAYSLYVLANAQMADLGTMNRLREHASTLTRTDNCLLASAYALTGRSDIGRTLIESPYAQGGSYWFGADVASLIAQTLLADGRAAETAEAVRQQLTGETWLSTSQTSFGLIAMTQFYRKNAPATGLKFRATLDGKSWADVSSDRFTWADEKAIGQNRAKLSVTNSGQSVLYLTATGSGTATQSEIEALANGLKLNVEYLDMNQQAIDVKSLPQSTTFKAQVTIQNVSGRKLQHVAMTHVLPAGWEVLGVTGPGEFSYYDVRDDRVLSYMDELQSGARITLTVNLSATYAGQYYLPSIHAEAMYDATISGCTTSGQCEVK